MPLLLMVSFIRVIIFLVFHLMNGGSQKLDTNSSCKPFDSVRISHSYAKLKCMIGVDVNSDTGLELKMTPKNHSFSLSCPSASDHSGKLRQAKHMCTASMRPYFCDFRLSNLIITGAGGLVDCESLKIISFSHPSMQGEKPIYNQKVHDAWSEGYEEAAKKTFNDVRLRLPVYDLVVPTRMRWDDCFNHLSFQSIPLIAHVREFYDELWGSLYWHASLFTAAILELLEVPKEKIIVQRSIRARQVLFPWIQGWCPPQLSTIHGIARRISKQMTDRLLRMTTPTDSAAIKTLPIASYEEYTKKVRSYNETMNISKSGKKQIKKGSSPHSKARRYTNGTDSRTVIYMTRSLKPGVYMMTRGVVNEPQLLQLLQLHLNPQYTLLVVGLTPEFKTVEELHASWRKFAAVFSRARLIIGPHGGAWNNVMWAPDDVDCIEFNEFPDDDSVSQSHGNTPVRHVFLTGFWARGPAGKFWIVEPSMKHPSDFYVGKMRIAPREIFEAIMRIDLEGRASSTPPLLKTGFRLEDFQTERHGIWKHPNPCYDCIPPPQ